VKWAYHTVVNPWLVVLCWEVYWADLADEKPVFDVGVVEVGVVRLVVWEG
jgi:hypothetical protein